MTDILFYNFNGRRNQLRKDFGQSHVLHCTFNLEYNLINPTLKIATTENFDYNYCYIPELRRYYFIDRKILRRNAFYELYLTLDVLQTYQQSILQMTGKVTYTNDNSASYYADTNIPVTVIPTIVRYEFENKFNKDGVNVLLATGYLS